MADHPLLAEAIHQSVFRMKGKGMVEGLRELVLQIAAHAAVAGVVRYGGRSVEAADAAGDLDLFVLVDDRPPGLESVHFYVGDVPVDLNVRTWADLEGDKLLTPIDHALFGGQILHDRDGDIAIRLHSIAERSEKRLPPLSEHDISFLRYGQRHSLDKVLGRLATDPVLCRLLLESNLYWAIRHYFQIRRLPFPGEKEALRYLGQHEPDVWQDIVRFSASTDLRDKLAAAEGLNRRILAPVGGLPHRDEVLTFGTDLPTIDLQTVGRNFLDGLLTPAGSSAPNAATCTSTAADRGTVRKTRFKSALQGCE